MSPGKAFSTFDANARRASSLQVWSGPLSGNGTVVGLANMCNGTHPITATWAELGVDLGSDVTCAVRDLYAGKDLPPAKGSISAGVGEHDIAVFRLTCRG